MSNWKLTPLAGISLKTTIEMLFGQVRLGWFYSFVKWRTCGERRGGAILLRALAQTTSYEVRLAFTLLSFVVLVYRYNLAYFYFFNFIYGKFFDMCTSYRPLISYDLDHRKAHAPHKFVTSHRGH
jgi:hypothetical protein